ncbi:3-hydroxyacyl-CoA dehydrogenase family protein [Virgibacillus pantothenticus]|uniref:3-hydroxyacyl-CoA dehydrogenase family protein n=1 Tax=Virgibacillus pantothenticus TaxID=1473 RepID=UPI001C226F13|nr:3-hydroxyacyl-CoA dehydrogenase family protein [Virgibacillus pantothenticus]MBU8567944.1 3-hydroxyacyl-CoA dehydrogenase family protein [Virgibacillus pantothenticus]MBU8601799.1 3-hydroxyacyl-CoA dehydrogenase family protein [Virgibacillus pantothenticus]MBU8635953.1 3-hydroxyacyl-CoA dehydrogenase family protein [Virgibacillus pantothenticus]MBU8643637.1 3-hydroxyacyl-CoA dehydrogenase family protein [Virgibacillus pantothenticus]MBU8647777.1 3-hydroxyacyl-CoA dehydrogenase family protei
MNSFTVAVIGAGVMGVGVTVDLTLHGLNVILVDINPNQLSKANKQIKEMIRYSSLLNNKLPKVDPGEAVDEIKFTTVVEDIKDCDFVIENITEDWAMKSAFYRKIDSICMQNVVFAANTSCISITKIASMTNRPDKVVGLHFMNPVILKDSIEVIRGHHTSEETLNESNRLLQYLNKSSIVVEDYPGFVANRISHLYMNEAAFVVQDQVANAKQVDEIFKRCYGHKMGPLETADLIGLDTVVNSLEVLYESYQDPKFRCCPLLKKMVSAGLLGRKSGKGFYDY